MDVDQVITDEPEYPAGSYPTKLVWLLSFLALYTTFIMVTIVWWTLVDVRSEREKLDRRQNDLNTVSAMLDSRLDKERWQILSILDGNPEVGEPPSQPLATLIEQYRTTTGRRSLDDSFQELERQIAVLDQIHQQSVQWADAFQRLTSRYQHQRNQVEDILDRLKGTISATAEKKRRQLDLKIDRLDQQTTALNGPMVREISTDIAMANTLSFSIRDIHDLTLLFERLLTETRKDSLVLLKDDKIRRLLHRLRRHPLSSNTVSPPELPPFTQLVDQLGEALFGNNFQLTEDTITVGDTPNLYAAALSRLDLLHQRQTIRNSLTTLTSLLRKQTATINNQLNTMMQQEAGTVESAVRRALHIILIVGLATATIFLAISYRIIREIKGQILEIERTNIILDKRTQALSKSEEALRQSEERLQLLSSNLLTAQEGERQRIAYELHDELGQSMAALKLQVGAIERQLTSQPAAKIKQDCHEIRLHISQIIENVRRLSKDLSPVVIDDLGLEAAIEYLAGNFAKLYNLQVHCDLPDINPLFPQENQRLIYRIIQEALNNIGKHAGATRVWIAAHHSGQLVTFQIRDDGCGFDSKRLDQTEATQKGIGLTAMVERVRILGGSISFASTPNQGTNITFTAPVLGAAADPG